MSESIETSPSLNWDDCSDYTSKSRCSTFKFCPYQYKKVYVDGERSSGYALTLGTRLHHWLEIFYDYCHLVKPEEWAEKFITSPYADFEKMMMNNFINDEIVRFYRLNGDLKLFVPRAREIKIVDPVNKIRGIIDRITDDPLVIEDYKEFLLEKFKSGDIKKAEAKILTSIIDGSLKEIICVEEYKSSKKIDEDDLGFEFGFYQLLLQALPEYKDKFMIGRLINPRLNVRMFIPIMGKTYVLKRIAKLREAVKNNEFRPNCNRYKFAFCRKCSLEECGLYDGIDNEWNAVRMVGGDCDE